MSNQDRAAIVAAMQQAGYGGVSRSRELTRVTLIWRAAQAAALREAADKCFDPIDSVGLRRMADEKERA